MTEKIDDISFETGTLPLEKMVLWEDNPRTISVSEFERLKESIVRKPYYLNARPIVLSDRTGKLVIIAGNQRYKAIKDLGWTEAPSIIFHCKTEAQEVEIAMVDNHNNGEWDTEKMANKFMDYPLDQWLGSDWEKMAGDFGKVEEVVEDEVPEPEENPDSKPGEIYILGGHKLMCGDSTSPADLQKLVGGGLINLWLTDPPYNIAYEGKTKKRLTIQNDSMENEEFRDFLEKSYQAASSVMREGAAFYIFHSDAESINFRAACAAANFQIHECLIWNKNSFILGRQDYHWKHEPCLYGWKDGSHKWYGDRKQTTVIDWPHPAKSEDHPTMKPVGLFALLIQNSTKPGDAVLDSFGGSGTTLVACEQTGRKCYMMELDPRYCDVIRRRYWTLATGSEEGWKEGTKAQ